MYIDKHVDIDEVVMVMGDWRFCYAKCGQHGCGQRGDRVLHNPEDGDK